MGFTQPCPPAAPQVRSLPPALPELRSIRGQTMPHYADGTEAKLGDRVRGTGYNLKDSANKPLEFEGIVVGVVPNSEACNIRVAFLRAAHHHPGYGEKQGTNVPEPRSVNIDQSAVI